MEINEFMDSIGYSDLAKQTFFANQTSESNYLIKKNSYYENEEQFLQDLKHEESENYYSAILYYFTRFAFDLKQEYLNRGFTLDEYIDTFKDLRIWNEVCILETGVCGLKETGWLTSHMHAGIVKLGRMQFQPWELEEDIVLKDKTLNSGTKILNVHIPAGAPISVDAIQDSLARAKKHFGSLYVHAESWLLDPTLKNYLKPSSNILYFASLFETYKLEEHYSIERYVFGVVSEDKSSYNATTSFAKAVKQALLAGEKFYEGFGVMQL